MKIKSIAVLLAMITLVMTFAGCSDGVTADTTAISKAPETTALTSRQTAKDYNGETFSILTWGVHDSAYTSWWDIYAESITGETINDAVWKRNNEVEQKYNIKIEAIPDGVIAKVNNSVNADDKAYDAVLLGIKSTMTLATSGSLLEVKELEGINTESKWWNTDAMQKLSVNNKNYFLMGDLNMQQWTQNALVYFNKKIAQEYHVEDLYQSVKDGTWTLDKYAQISSGIYSDLNNNNQYDEFDKYGTVTSNYGVPCLVYGGNFNFVKKDKDDLLKLDIKEGLYSVFDKVVDICHSSSTLFTDLPQYKVNRGKITWTAFGEGRALFLIEKFDVYNQIREMEDDFGLLPMPKKDENQKTYTTWTHNGNGAVTSVPVYVDVDMTSRILDDMAFYSMGFVRPAYYETLISRRFVRDEASLDMLDMIINNVIYDWGYINIGIQDDLRSLATKNEKNLASTIASRESVYQTNIDLLNTLE